MGVFGAVREFFWPSRPAAAPTAVSRPAVRMFAGARITRLHDDWMTRTASIDDTLKSSLRLLRDRSRTLETDNPHAARYVQLAVTNIIGRGGIQLEMRATNARGELYRGVNAAIEEAWWRWGMDPGTASVDGRLTWHDIERLAVRCRKVDGEFLALLVPRPSNPFGLAVKVLDPDQLAMEYERPASRTTNAVRMGVEVDGDGRPVAYYIWDGHPQGAERGQLRRYPAEDVIHSYHAMRPGQTRGVPAFAPVLTKLRHLDAYHEAELVAARAGAAKPMVYSATSQDAPDILPHDEVQQAIPEAVEPGMSTVLPIGWRADLLDPTHPNTAFGDFVRDNLMAAAMGLGCSYMSLTGDLRNANYSSGRIGMLDERDNWRMEALELIPQLHQRVFARWLAAAFAAGAITLPAGSFGRFLASAMWQSRGWPWVDPAKDLDALERSIKLGVNSRTRATMEMGVDLEETLEHLAEEQVLAASLGVSIDGVRARDRFTGGTHGAGAGDDAGADDADGAPGDDPDGGTADRGLPGEPGRRLSAA